MADRRARRSFYGQLAFDRDLRASGSGYDRQDRKPFDQHSTGLHEKPRNLRLLARLGLDQPTGHAVSFQQLRAKPEHTRQHEMP